MTWPALDSPREWEVFRRSYAYPELIQQLEACPHPLAQTRLAEAMASFGPVSALPRVQTLLPELDARLRPAIEIVTLARIGLWHDARTAARAYRQPEGTSPLELECGCLVGIHGAMVERHLGDVAAAERFLGQAAILTLVLGLKSRGVHIRGEMLRGGTLAGRGDPGAIRALLSEPDLTAIQELHNTHNLAEALGARAEYQQALAVVESRTDARSVGMSCFYRAMLGEVWHDPGGTDDWLRLARAVNGYRPGRFDPEHLSGMVYEPQATYARLLTGAAVLRGPQPARALLSLGAMPPGPHDQRVCWVIGRMGVLTRGWQMDRAHETLKDWREALSGMYHLAPLLRVFGFSAPAQLWLLSHLHDAGEELAQWREAATVLRGETLTVGATVHRASGRVGSVLIAEAAGAVVEPLRGAEVARWEKRLMLLEREGIHRGVLVNPGLSIRAALEMRATSRRNGLCCPELEALPAELAADLAPDAQAMLYPLIEEEDPC